MEGCRSLWLPTARRDGARCCPLSEKDKFQVRFPATSLQCPSCVACGCGLVVLDQSLAVFWFLAVNESLCPRTCLWKPPSSIPTNKLEFMLSSGDFYSNLVTSRADIIISSSLNLVLMLPLNLSFEFVSNFHSHVLGSPSPRAKHQPFVTSSSLEFG